jgi:hypothetical protein
MRSTIAKTTLLFCTLSLVPLGKNAQAYPYFDVWLNNAGPFSVLSTAYDANPHALAEADQIISTDDSAYRNGNAYVEITDMDDAEEAAYASLSYADTATPAAFSSANIDVASTDTATLPFNNLEMMAANVSTTGVTPLSYDSSTFSSPFYTEPQSGNGNASALMKFLLTILPSLGVIWFWMERKEVKTQSPFRVLHHPMDTL